MSDAPHLADPAPEAVTLDDMWQRQQQKTFTAWVNSHLRKRSLKVENVQTDLSDGKLLLALMEIVGDDTLPKPARGNMRIHKIENVSKAFKFIAEKGVKLISIGPEEIVDGNLKMILGMLWTIILRFEIQDISVEAMSAKDALLLWCQRKTQPYSNVNMTNFHMSWKDGLAFCALIHRHRPELIDYDSLRKDNPAENFRTAFTVADKELDIPPMLDAEDMINCIKPDERSVMTYVAAYYKAFASSGKAETASKKIAHVLEMHREHEQLIEEYETRASDLLAWVQAAIARLNERPGLDTADTCLGKLTDFNKFQAEEYPPKLKEKGDLESHYSTLQTKLRLSGRPAYVPSEGKLITDIRGAWSGLGDTETAHKAWILEELHRCQLAENKAERFRARAASHEAWTGGKDAMLRTDDYSTASLSQVMTLKKKHEAFQSDLTAHEARVHEIGTLANELDELHYFAADEINDRYATIYEQWQALIEVTNERQANLDAAELKQQQLEELRLDFAKEAAPLMNSLDIAYEIMTDNYIANTEQDVGSLQETLQQLVTEIEGPYTASYQSLAEIVEKMSALGSTENLYTVHTMDKLTERYNQVKTQVETRTQQLASELENQANREQLRRDWAEKATAAEGWFNEKSASVGNAVSSGDYSSLEDQVAALQALEAECTGYQASFEELESLHVQVQTALIFDNPHTTLSIEVLRSLYQQLQQNVQMQITETSNQILTRDGTNLSEEQIKEYRESFKHFDKSGDNKLDRVEFRACLISLGYDIPQVAQEGDPDKEFQRVYTRVDPNSDGVVSFEEYMAFMAEEHADAETSEQLLEAFKAVAAGKEYVLADDLRDLAPELAEYCIANMSPYEGGPEGALDFQSFAMALYGQSDL